jgi:hypothetical protein
MSARVMLVDHDRVEPSLLNRPIFILSLSVQPTCLFAIKEPIGEQENSVSGGTSGVIIRM